MIDFDKQARYQFTSQDYSILQDCMQQIAAVMARAKVIEKRARCSSGANAEPVVIEREIITPEREAEIMGPVANNMVYFDFDAQKWNRDTISGIHQKYQKHIAKEANEFKKLLESYTEYSSNYELVAYVGRTAPESEYPGPGRIINNPRDGHGRAFLSTIVSRDKLSGKILPMSNKFIGVSCYPRERDAIQNGASWFLQCALRQNSAIIHAILDNFVHVY